jgi:hypothetical protein
MTATPPTTTIRARFSTALRADLQHPAADDAQRLTASTSSPPQPPGVSGNFAQREVVCATSRGTTRDLRAARRSDVDLQDGRAGLPQPAAEPGGAGPRACSLPAPISHLDSVVLVDPRWAHAARVEPMPQQPIAAHTL